MNFAPARRDEIKLLGVFIAAERSQSMPQALMAIPVNGTRPRLLLPGLYRVNRATSTRVSNILMLTVLQGVIGMQGSHAAIQKLVRLICERVAVPGATHYR